MQPQLHAYAGKKILSSEHFCSVQNGICPFRPFSHWTPAEKERPQLMRPYGGLWTSTYNREYYSEWVRWFYKKLNLRNVCATLLYPSEHAHVLTIDNFQDFERVLYRNRRTFHSKKIPYLDFERLAKKYDGLRVTQKAIVELEKSEPYFLKHWDVESTIWFRLDVFSKIEKIEIKRG